MYNLKESVKMNKKNGFVFVETIIIIVILVLGLVAVYVSLSSVLSNENRRATYNDAAYTYRTYYLEDYLTSLNIEDFVKYYMRDQGKMLQEFTCNNPILYNLNYIDNDLTTSDITFDTTNMSEADLIKESFCEIVINRLNVKKVYITNYDVNEIKYCATRTGSISSNCDKNKPENFHKYEGFYSMDTNMIYYIRTLSGNSDHDFRLIVEYEEEVTDSDDTISKILINNEMVCPDGYKEGTSGNCERKIVRNYFNNVKMYLKTNVD